MSDISGNEAGFEESGPDLYRASAERGLSKSPNYQCAIKGRILSFLSKVALGTSMFSLRRPEVKSPLRNDGNI